VWFFRVLPRSAALAIGSAAGRIIPLFARKEYRLAVGHLALAFGKEKSEGELRTLAREMFRKLAMNFVDTVRIGKMATGEINSVVVAHNFDRLLEVYRQGHGVIALSSHSGCWELMGVWLATIGGLDVHAIAKRLYDPRIEELILDTRRSGGMNVISRGENTREIIRALKKGHLVGMLVDQDLKVKGEFVEFFGKAAHTTTAPAFLSLRYGAPIVPMFTCRDDDHRHHIYFGEPLTVAPSGDPERDVRELTILCSKATEDFIREHPDQWVWFHRRWKTQPPSDAVSGKEGES
jgi:KDO2-lipid IV(A) lauroyltransferase